MSKENLRATVIGDHLDSLVDSLQQSYWSTAHVSATEIRNLKPDKVVMFQPFIWLDVLIIEATLWNDGIRSKIESVVKTPVIVADSENGVFDFQKLLQQIRETVEVS